jgi:hypothetical protein
MFMVLRMRLLFLKTSRNKRRDICTNIITMGKFGLAMEGNQIVNSNMNWSFGLEWNYV